MLESIRFRTLRRSRLNSKDRNQVREADAKQRQRVREKRLTNGLIIYLNPRDSVVSARLSLTGGWERYTVTPVFARLVKNTKIFVDVGANLGWYTLHAARGSRGGRSLRL